MNELLYLSHNSFRYALPCTDYIYPIGIEFHRVIKTKPRLIHSPHIFFSKTSSDEITNKIKIQFYEVSSLRLNGCSIKFVSKFKFIHFPSLKNKDQ